MPRRNKKIGLALMAFVYTSTLLTVLARGADLSTVVFGTLLYGAGALVIARFF